MMQRLRSYHVARRQTHRIMTSSAKNRSTRRGEIHSLSAGGTREEGYGKSIAAAEGGWKANAGERLFLVIRTELSSRGFPSKPFVAAPEGRALSLRSSLVMGRDRTRARVCVRVRVCVCDLPAALCPLPPPPRPAEAIERECECVCV